MDEIKKINYDEIREIVASKGFNPDLILKDYYVTAVLYMLKDIKGIYFKGGTALQKIFLNYSRLSEDVDFTLTKRIKEIKIKITRILKQSRLFERITKDKDVEGFIRLIAHYKNFSKKDDTIFIDLNGRSKILLKPENYRIKHFYKDNIPEFSIETLAREEILAEKMAAAIGRNRPRDHYDLYRIIREKMQINLTIVKKKCSQSNVEFNIIKMFNRAKKLKRRWDDDLMPLLANEVDFKEVMTTLAKYFKLKEEKEKLKK
jgi:predicted nucleotidyltransferase component of viral defense system